MKLDIEEHASRACFVQDGRVTLTVSAVKLRFCDALCEALTLKNVPHEHAASCKTAE